MRRSGTGITDFHGKYFAHELTRPGRHGVDRLSQSLFDASVDLKHDIEAKRDALIEALEKKMVQATETDVLFMLRWTIV